MASPIYLGPLTTTFSAPTSCFSLTALVDSDGIPFQMYTGGFAEFGLMAAPYVGTDCFPSAYPATAGDNWGPYFSPGICPSRYTIASSSVNSSETRGVCCLTGLTANDYLNCQTTITGTLTALQFITVKPDGPYPLETGITKIGSSLLLIGSAIEVRWREGGANPPPTQPLYTPPTTSTSDPPRSEHPNTVEGHSFTAVATSLQTVISSSQSGSFPTVAKIGIGVGVAALMLLVLAAAVGLYLGRRWRRLAEKS
ncbi:hypothetical protein AA313_de0207185 [Arthrobotrys entomopaga]|nr:hypothetical protein AA313_de0207185 [Arthrobotrys entomopaga]